jgi:hypothetical protein
MMGNLQHDTGSARQRSPRREHHSHRPHRSEAEPSSTINEKYDCGLLRALLSRRDRPRADEPIRAGPLLILGRGHRRPRAADPRGNLELPVDVEKRAANRFW